MFVRVKIEKQGEDHTSEATAREYMNQTAW